jgi:flagellar hook assembly protein FlgD
VKRLPVAAFVALALLTVAAFFFTQHLKVSTPLVAGNPKPHPATINPVSGGVCPYPSGAHGRLKPTSFRRMKVSFYLLNKSDDVDVDIVTPDGELVDQIASDVKMIGGKNAKRRGFSWDGRTGGGTVAPDGVYDIKVVLHHQDRSVIVSDPSTGTVRPVTVQTKPPAIRVTSVAGADGTKPAVIPAPGGGAATIRYDGTGKLRPQIQIYRVGVNGRLHLVKTFSATTSSGTSEWNGTLQHKRPAPQGTYLVGLRLTDASCTHVRWPASLHPAPGSTPHAGVTVRYLAAQPSLGPVAPGSTATVEVDSRRHRYRWALRRVGSNHVLKSGSSSSVSLGVKLPAGGAGLYGLALRWGAHRTVVPLIAGGPGSAASAPGDTSPTSPSSRGHVLVVLPALTWQGLNPVDDDGDGIPNTLRSGEPVRLQRPLLDTPPPGFAGESALIAYLRRAHLKFDLTTDLALIDGMGPSLSHYSGAVLAGDERWLPTSAGASLSAYVQQGGRVLSLGIASLQRSVTVRGGQALDPGRAHAVDALDARPRPVERTHGALLLVQRDQLGIFRSGATALSGYRTYQPFGPMQSPARLLSAAGVSNRSPAVIGYRLGHGDVVDIGLPGFAASLAHQVEAKELLGRVWSLLSK